MKTSASAIQMYKTTTLQYEILTDEIREKFHNDLYDMVKNHGFYPGIMSFYLRKIGWDKNFAPNRELFFECQRKIEAKLPLYLVSDPIQLEESAQFFEEFTLRKAQKHQAALIKANMKYSFDKVHEVSDMDIQFEQQRRKKDVVIEVKKRRRAVMPSDSLESVPHVVRS